MYTDVGKMIEIRELNLDICLTVDTHKKRKDVLIFLQTV